MSRVWQGLWGTGEPVPQLESFRHNVCQRTSICRQNLATAGVDLSAFLLPSEGIVPGPGPQGSPHANPASSRKWQESESRPCSLSCSLFNFGQILDLSMPPFTHLPERYNALLIHFEALF